MKGEDEGELARRFSGRHAAEGGAIPDGALGPLLATLIARAQAAHPELPLEPLSFVEALADRVEAGVTLAAIDAIHVADLHLALACARGDDAAIARVDRLVGADLDQAIAKSPRLGVTTDEFRQRMREHLFLGVDGKPPRIASYSGRGPLKGWVRVSATRLVIDLSRARAEPRATASDDLLARLPAHASLELAMLRGAYGVHLPEAFADAVAQLSPRQRNLLRQRYVHELGGERIGAIYGVHRATVFGWLDEARRALLQQVRRALAERIPETELESVVAALGSQLHVSVHRLLDAAIEDEPPA